MKILSWIVHGLGSRENRALVKEVIRNCKADIVVIQESKLKVVSEKIVKEVWGACSAEWVCRDFVETSGEILVIWNRKVFNIKDQWIGKFSVSVVLEEVGANVE